MTSIEKAKELKDYTEADANIRFRRITPVLKKLISQRARGTYRHSDALDDFKYIAEGGAKNYGKEFSVDWKSFFPEEVRTIVAQAWLEEFEAEDAGDDPFETTG